MGASNLDISELERRMRPGHFGTFEGFEPSIKGFLGVDESLEEVLKEDENTVKRLGITHENIGDSLNQFMKEAREYRIDKWVHETPTVEFENALKPFNGIEKQYVSDMMRRRKILESMPPKPPQLHSGYEFLEFRLYAGFGQDCPWGDVGSRVKRKDDEKNGEEERFNEDLNTDSEYLISESKTGAIIIIAGLLIHLIGVHHFYEGKKSPYECHQRC